MNIRLLARQLGRFTLAFSLLPLPGAFCALCFLEWSMLGGFLAAMAIAAAIGLLLAFAGRHARGHIFRGEGVALLGLGWLVATAAAALPYLFAGQLGLVDALFEAASNLTASGFTVLAQGDTLPLSLVFWRAFACWAGGFAAILVFAVVLPHFGAGGRPHFSAGGGSSDPHALGPRLRDTARVLGSIYAGLTFSEIVLLRLAGMPFFDAACHALGTLSTAGIRNATGLVPSYGSLQIELVLVAFMAISGSSFALYRSVLQGHWSAMLKNSEWRLYAAVLAGATLLAAANLLGIQGETPRTPGEAPVAASFGHALRLAAFQVAAVVSGSNFCTGDYDAWPQFSRMLFLVLIIVGPCSCTAGGGFKLFRVILLFKITRRRLELTFRPKTIRAIRIDEEVVDTDTQKNLFGFCILYGIALVSAGILLSACGLPFESATTAAIAALSNAGAGLQLLGPLDTAAFLNAPAKLVLALCMILGRLELYCIFILAVPSFWKRA
ncbi:MAG: TrkH family potassium uptake protein [Candidatus Hydrogenedentes bacterium]|nr:TrkH family potassium uptake protein [Candidatus Hydrogenedentota bacterium]